MPIVISSGTGSPKSWSYFGLIETSIPETLLPMSVSISTSSPIFAVSLIKNPFTLIWRGTFFVSSGSGAVLSSGFKRVFWIWTQSPFLAIIFSPSYLIDRTDLGTGKSAIVFKPGSALITIGIIFVAIAIVAFPPGISGFIARFIFGSPYISI